MDGVDQRLSAQPGEPLADGAVPLGQPYNVETPQLHAEIDLIVMEMFAKYPGRPEN